MKTEISVADRDIFVSVSHVVFPHPGTRAAGNNGVPDLASSGHLDLLELEGVDVVIVRSTVRRAEIEDDPHLTRLRDREDWVAAEIGKGGSHERTTGKTSLDPSDDVVCDLLAMCDRRGSVAGIELGERRRKLVIFWATINQ